MVKFEIEGAEEAIFKQDSSWLKSVSLIKIEIHDCWKEVFDALSEYQYSARISGENVIIEFTNN